MAETQAEREALIHTTDKLLTLACEALDRAARPEPVTPSVRAIADASQAVLNLLTIRRFLEAEGRVKKAEAAMSDMADKMVAMLHETGPVPPKH